MCTTQSTPKSVIFLAIKDSVRAQSPFSIIKLGIKDFFYGTLNHRTLNTLCANRIRSTWQLYALYSDLYLSICITEKKGNLSSQQSTKINSVVFG